MIQASARLLRLLSLLHARPTWTGAELAERLAITPRTLRRDVDRLRRLDYPVEAASGVAGGYQLGPGSALPPLLLDEEEATAVFLGLHVARGTGISEAGTAGMRALAKLERSVPSRLRKNLLALSGSVIGLAVRSRPLSLAALVTLARACRERSVTTFAYAGRDGARTERCVEPLRLVRASSLFYLIAWDVPKQDWRVFRLDRMSRVEAQAARFDARPPPDDDLAAYVTRSLTSAPHPHRARVRLHAPLVHVQARAGAFDALFGADGPDHCTMDVGAPTLDVLVARILWMGIDFEIVSGPDELRDHVKSIILRLQASVVDAGTTASVPGVTRTARRRLSRRE